MSKMIMLKRPKDVFELTDFRIFDEFGEDIGWVVEHRVAGFKFAFVFTKRRLTKKERKELGKELKADVVYRIDGEFQCNDD